MPRRVIYVNNITIYDGKRLLWNNEDESDDDRENRWACSDFIRYVIDHNLPNLSERQLYCIKGYLEAKTYVTMAIELGITYPAVRRHCVNSMRKIREFSEKNGLINAAAIRKFMDNIFKNEGQP